MPNSDPVQNYSLNFRKQEGTEPCSAQSKTSIEETGPPHVTSQTTIKETCADTLSISPRQAYFSTQRTIPATERKSHVIPGNSSHGGALPTAVSKMVTRMVRHYDQDDRQPDAALQWDTIRPVLLKAFAKHGEHEISQKTLASTYSSRKQQDEARFEYCEDSKNSLAYFRAIQGHSGGITIDPELMEHIPIPYSWKEYVFFNRRLQSASNLSWRTDSFQVERTAREDDRLSSSHHSILSGESDEEEARDDYTISQKMHHHRNWKRYQDAVYWVKLSRAQDRGL